MPAPLSGVFAAAVTPLLPDRSIDLDAIPSFLEFLAGRGCHGILLLGTTGEGPSFSPEERTQVFQKALEVRHKYPDLRLLAGTGTPSLSETAALTRAAFDLGYDGVVVLPPYYYRKVPAQGLLAYFSDLIRQAVPSDGALFWYHIPTLTGIPLSMDLLARLKDAFPLQFAGLKDSSHEPEFASLLGDRFGDTLTVFTGTDSLFHAALQNHAAGCITAPANLISPQLRVLWDTFHRGEDVTGLQQRITDIRHLLEQLPPFPPLLKALLASQHGFPRWPVRPPLMDVEETITLQVIHALDDLG